MKKGYIKIAWWALLTAGLGGCATDDALKEGGHDNGLTDVGTNYLAFNIVSDAGTGTRAWPGVSKGGDFDKGEDGERAIATSGNYAVFFNQDNTFHSIVELGIDKLSKEQDVTEHNDKEVSVGSFIANIKVDEGQSLPTKVLILLNVRPYRVTEIEMDFRKPMAERLLVNKLITPVDDVDYMLSSLTRELSDDEIEKANASVVLYTPGDGNGGKTNYCMMSNAVYVGSGTEQTGQVYNITEIGDNICDTEEAAAAKPLTVHVERLAVKVETTIKGIDVASSSEGATYAWTVDDKMHVSVYGNNKTGLHNEKDRLMYPIVMEPLKVEGVEDEVNQVNPDGTVTNTDVKPVKWAFSMLGWSVNGTARRTYLVKNLNDQRVDMDGAQDGTLHHNEITASGVQSKIEHAFFGNWNDASRFRCYWAVDGRYADPSVYPVQYREVMDNSGKNSFVGRYDGKEDGSPLYYYSFSQLRQLAYGFAPTPGVSSGGIEHMIERGNLLGDTRYRYCPENVLGQKLLEGKTYLGASTHVIIIGQLLLGEEINTYKKNAKDAAASTEELLNTVHDKFYADGCYWDRESYMQYAYDKIYQALKIGNQLVKDMFSPAEKKADLTTPAKRFTWSYKYNKHGDEKTGDLSETYMKELAAKLDMNKAEDKLSSSTFGPDGFQGEDDGQTENIFRLVRAKTTNGDGRVMLGLKDGYTLVLKGRDEADRTDVTVDVSATQFLGIVYEFAGLADYYAKGRMYYYTPIRHVTTSRENNQWQLGDIGIVRNNWYQLTISSLLKPGIPVAEPEQPIIPNIDPADMYLGVEIHILPWHVIKQDIELQ